MGASVSTISDSDLPGEYSRFDELRKQQYEAAFNHLVTSEGKSEKEAIKYLIEQYRDNF